MRNLYARTLALLFFTFGFTAAGAQEYLKGRLLARVADASYIPSARYGGYLSVADPVVSSVLAGHRVYGVRQAFPDSRKEQLLNVYEMACDCDAAALMYDLRKAAGHRYPDMELVPEAAPLFTPNDYTLNGSHYALDLINARQAWDVTRGSSNIRVAILDGGCSFPDDLQGQIVFAYPDAASVSTGPIVAHGTFVAGCVAAQTDNELGISGAGFNSKLMIYKGFDYNLILHATYKGARVVNLSWMNGCSPVSFYQEVINEAYDNGVVLVASAGNGTLGGHCNDSQGMPFGYVYPASYDHVISVSSVGPDDNHEKFIGDTTKLHTHNDKVDICAPGFNVLGIAPGNVYGTAGGTSVAAPFVSGVCALILSINPSLQPNEVEAIIRQTAAVIDTLSYNQRYQGKLGAGRIDAGRACLLALAGKNQSANNYSTKEQAYADPQAVSNTPEAKEETYSVTESTGGVNHTVITSGILGSGERYLLVRLAKGTGRAESFSADGRRVASHMLYEGENLVTFGPGDLPQGLYFIRINGEGGAIIAAGKYLL